MNQVVAKISQASLLAGACVVIAASAGCGSSVYGEKFNHRLEELQISSEFSVLRDPTDDLPINFRFPMLFTKEFNRVSVDLENDNKRILPTKFAPPFLPDFPGQQLMLEGDFINKDVRTPIFLYVGEGDPTTVKGKFPYEQWRERLGRSLMKPEAWKQVEVQTPKGGKLSWNRLTAKGKFEYDVERNRKIVLDAVDTFFQLWVYEPKDTPQAIAVLGWWSTEEVRLPSDIEKLARLTAGTAVVSPRAVAAAAAAAAPPAKPK